MNKIVALGLFFLVGSGLFAQPPGNKPPSKADMDKMMEDAMKGMSESDKADMKKMMGQLMPTLEKNAGIIQPFPEIKSNRDLIPKKDLARINAIPKKRMTNADIKVYAGTMLSKLMSKAPAAEITLLKTVSAKMTTAADLNKAAVEAMLKGHPEAAMGLGMKAVQADPSSALYQNNMAALLTQYGYPEQAIPVLQKLAAETPNNSTLLNNLAQAWLGLGATDSAQRIIRLATAANPYNPEAKLCGGLMDELHGDPIKAKEAYEDASGLGFDDFANNVFQNAGGEATDSYDMYEKLKHSITVYEYFPKDWIKIPELSNNVSGHDDDKATIGGYRDMQEALDDGIKTLTDNYADQIAGDGSDDNAVALATEMLDGVSMMSKPAVIVQKVLFNYLKDWMFKQADEWKQLVEKERVAREKLAKVMSKSYSKDQCQIPDKAKNEYLETVNPPIREFYLRKAEEFRQWLNIFCTWNWYLVGNPRNVIIQQDLGQAGSLANFYISAITELKTEDQYCRPSDPKENKKIDQPKIPDFKCPIVIPVPMGKDWQDITSKTKKLDASASGISPSGKAIPNAAVSLGLDASITDAGLAPYLQSSANSLVTHGMGKPVMSKPADGLDELAPLATPAQMGKWKIAQQLLSKMISSDCSKVSKAKFPKTKFSVEVGTIQFEPDNETGEKFEISGSGFSFEGDPATYYFDKNGNLVASSYSADKLDQAIKDGTFSGPAKEGSSATGAGKVKLTPDAAATTAATEQLNTALKVYDANGFQPTITAGVQPPGLFQVITGLFK